MFFPLFVEKLLDFIHCLERFHVSLGLEYLPSSFLCVIFLEYLVSILSSCGVLIKGLSVKVVILSFLRTLGQIVATQNVIGHVGNLSLSRVVKALVFSLLGYFINLFQLALIFIFVLFHEGVEISVEVV